MHIELITKATEGITGTSRYADQLCLALKLNGADVAMHSPRPASNQIFRLSKRLGFDLQVFFTSYPLRMSLPVANLYHITSQTLATLPLFQRFPSPLVVTVLDIIPYLVRHDVMLRTLDHPVDRLFYRLALRGLHRADALIAISAYTKSTLVDTLHLAPERIHVVYLGIDHSRFRPTPVPVAFRAKYQLDERNRYLLYVGSEDPRKNLDTLIHAFARLRTSFSHLKLLKVGKPHFPAMHTRLLKLISDLGMQEDILFFDEVSEDDLPLFYNVADVFVMPSLYEGFGFPVLEAMACGTPVVCSNSTALGEIASEAALTVDPLNIEALTQAIANLLNDPALYQQMQERGIKWAANFTWAQTAAQTQQVYALQRRSF